MKALRLFIGCSVLTILFSLAAAAQTVQTDFDRSFNLGSLRSFDFASQDRTPGDPLEQSPLNDRRIHDALDSQLKLHGLTGESDRPDFVIRYFVTTRKGFDVQDNRTGVLHRMGGLNVSQVTEGTLVVTFSDRSTGQEVWRGLVSGVITPKDLDKDLNKSIGKLVDKFVRNQAGRK